MTHTPEGDSVLRRLWHRVLDGDTVWGSMAVRPQRWGATSYRIVIYPPGVSVEERRRVRIWRGFPEWGVLLWLSAAAALSGLTDPGTAAAIATTATLSAGATAFTRAKAHRKLVQSTELTLPYPNSDIAMLVRARLIESIGTAMNDADNQLRDGKLSPGDHEAIWWQAYDQLERETVIPSVGRYGVIR